MFFRNDEKVRVVKVLGDQEEDVVITKTSYLNQEGVVVATSPFCNRHFESSLGDVVAIKFHGSEKTVPFYEKELLLIG